MFKTGLQKHLKNLFRQSTAYKYVKARFLNWCWGAEEERQGIATAYTNRYPCSLFTRSICVEQHGERHYLYYQQRVLDC